MLIELIPNLSYQAATELIERLEWMGFHVVRQGNDTLTLVSGVDKLVNMEGLATLPGIAKIQPLKSRFKLASRESKSADTQINIKNVTIGGGELFVIAGPCSIESEAQLLACATVAKNAGAQALRGGAYKPRTSPYEYQGMGVEGFKLLSKVANLHGLISVSEIMDTNQMEEALPYIDILQIGARNIQNYSLLKALGKIDKPILLKRGFATTYQELLMAAEYIMVGGNPNVILCERGIRTFETYTRNTLDLNAVPSLQEMTHLPVIVDPSHGTGVRSLVPIMARAAVAAGANGILVETHPHPDLSISDATQTISFASFTKMMHEIKAVHCLVKSFTN
ncbi:MAG: aroF [Burkholderiales bacterium]|jgi:3-deoxy-7-phosphoheptulonate synthase|nr:aroF [Burkholderiales bacterium]